MIVDTIKRYKYLFIIFLFIFLGYIRYFSFWSPERAYIFGDTNIYALQLANISSHLKTIFNIKDSILLWNPYYYAGGIPTLSQIDSGIFYPINIFIAFLAGLLGKPLATLPLYNFSIFFHLGLGAIFIYLLLKNFFDIDDEGSIIGALLWIFIGYNVEFVAAGDMIMEGAYLPICIFFILAWRKTRSLKYFFAFFIALAFNLLLGYPIMSVIIYGLSLFIYIVFESTLNRKVIADIVKTQLIGMLFITIPLISILYLPAFLNFSYSVRSSLPLGGLFHNSASGTDLLESLMPKNRLFNNSNPADIYLYFSLVGLIILIQAKTMSLFQNKKYLWLVFLGAVGLVISLGDITFLPFIMYFLMPGVSLFRRLSLFSIIPSFVFIILVASSLKSAFNNKSLSAPVTFILKILFTLFVLIQAALIIGLDRLVPNLHIDYLIPSLIFVFIIGASTLFILFLHEHFPKFTAYFLMLILLLEFGTTVSSRGSIQSKIDPRRFFGQSVLTQFLHDKVKPMERIDFGPTQYNYKTDYLNFEQTGGYLSLGSSYSNAINHALYASDYNSENLRNLLGIKYRISYVDPSKDKGGNNTIIEVPADNIDNPQFYRYTNKWEPELPGKKIVIQNNSGAFPRVYLANVQMAEQNSKIMNLIEKIKMPPPTVFIGQSDFRDLPMGSSGYTTIEEYRRNYLRVRVESYGPSFLANSTAYYPGWTVKINNRPTNLIRTNWFMMGAYIPDGINEVEFQYVPDGLLFALGYMVLIGGIWLISPLRKQLLSLLI